MATSWCAEMLQPWYNHYIKMLFESLWAVIVKTVADEVGAVLRLSSQ